MREPDLFYGVCEPHGGIPGHAVPYPIRLKYRQKPPKRRNSHEKRQDHAAAEGIGRQGTSQDGQQQPSQAKPPVNGTVERKAENTTIGNDLAASSTSTEADKLKGMTRQQRVAYLEKKYGR